ncbi:small integral membrane protein 1 [Genypterus blacodes]|uniref:small integral membrane protein 1 n=1 Tax=Genypterus blacodes TaxID=154954 RepID=UPI003F769A7B
MDANNEGSVQYNRWNDENINMDVEASQSAMMRTYNKFCTGRLGIVLKAGGALTALVVIYIIGYTTGYYVHSC